MRGWQPLHPPAGAPREHGKAMLGTRVTFPSRGKSPKARRGCAPSPPEGDRAKSVSLFAPAPPAASRNPLDRAFSHNKRTDLPLWIYGQIGPVFSSGFIEGTLSIFNSWLGRWVASEDTANFILSQPIPLEHRAGGSKGATPPSPGVQGPGGPWRIFRSIYAATFLYARK